MTLANEPLLLSSSYKVENRTVYSTDIFSHISKKFELAKIPSYSFEAKVPTTKILSIFKQNGIELTSHKAFYTKFYTTMNFDEEKIKSELYNKFTDNYDELQIDEILIKPTTKTNLDGFFIHSIEIGKFALNSAKGVVGVHFKNNENESKNIYFNFEIVAKQKLLLSSTSIKSGDIFSNSNLSYTFVPFEKKQITTTINVLDSNYFCASRNIQKGVPITDNMIKKLDIIKKGSTVTVVYSKGYIDIEFTATAMQSGTFDEMIIVKKDNKTYKARVVDGGLVAIE
jgi:flagella basal body P-ring formation protein FlgA